MTLNNPSAAPKIYGGSGINLRPASDAAWLDVDLSAVVPVGTKYALILAKVTGGGPHTIGVRENGSALNIPQPTIINSTYTNIVPVDDNRIIEIWMQVKNSCASYALAWWS